jgi:hypothetical protein
METAIPYRLYRYDANIAKNGASVMALEGIPINSPEIMEETGLDQVTETEMLEWLEEFRLFDNYGEIGIVICLLEAI